VLDCWEAEQPPFTQATLVHFRQRLCASQLDRRVLERVVELAEAAGGFGRRQLKLALDSSPLWGAGRVEDTVNLLGTALRRAVAVLAQQSGQLLAAQAAEPSTLVLWHVLDIENNPHHRDLHSRWEDEAARAGAAEGRAARLARDRRPLGQRAAERGQQQLRHRAVERVREAQQLLGLGCEPHQHRPQRPSRRFCHPRAVRHHPCSLLPATVAG